MKLQRFFGDFNLNEKILTVNDAGFYNQIKNVLRLSAGDRLILCDGKNNEAEAEVDSISKDGIKLKIGKVATNENETKIKTVLYCAILKRENFELVIQKATEIGVKRIVPVITARTVKLAINTARLKAIAKEAAEQSGRGIVPEISKPMSFEDARKDAKTNSVNYFFDISGKPLVSFKNNFDTAGIFIGPEGGWEGDEIKIARDQGYNFVSLGSLTLRAETAAIVASYSLINSNK